MSNDEFLQALRMELLGYYQEAIRSSHKTGAELGMHLDVFINRVDKIAANVKLRLEAAAQPVTPPNPVNNQPMPQGGRR